MIKVILPINNDNIDLYFNTKEASLDIKKLKREELERILSISLNSKTLNYEVFFDNRTNGQFFIVETESEKKWISLSADYTRSKDDGGSTNAYFVQFIPMAIVNSFLDETSKEKRLELYLMGINHNRAKTKAQQIYYRLAKTAGIRILNEFNFNSNVKINIATPFENINEWKELRRKNASSNKGNKSSYVIENQNSYTFYGKTFGANGRESIFLLYVLAKLAKAENKKIYLYEVNDNGSFAFETSSNEERQKFKNMLKKLNVVYYQDSIEYINNEEYETLDDENRDARYQAEFMRNLLIKYNSKRDKNGNIKYDQHEKPIIVDDIKRCYLCGCDIQHLIIASHIHRVADINKLNLPFKEKRKLAVDGDNGLWLCANHDKLFEHGLIYFNDNELVLANELNENQREYVNQITFNIKNIYEYKKDFKIGMKVMEDSVPYGSPSFCIMNEHYNENMKTYLDIHRNRIL